MNVPHRDVSQLVPPSAWQIDPEHRFYGSACQVVPKKWAEDQWIEKFLQVKGHRSDYIASQVASLQSIRWLLELQAQGLAPRTQRPLFARAGLPTPSADHSRAQSNGKPRGRANAAREAGDLSTDRRSGDWQNPLRGSHYRQRVAAGSTRTGLGPDRQTSHTSTGQTWHCQYDDREVACRSFRGEFG